MMRKLVLILVPVLAAAVFFVLRAADYDTWTTDSPEALAAFEHGLEAEMKLYGSEAARNYREALRLDPSFVAPRVRLLGLTAADREYHQELAKELHEVDPSHLSDRERFLLELALTSLDRRTEDGERVLEEFIAKHPKDPFGLEARCNRAAMADDPEAAERCFQDLVRAEPNWVRAQNMLGYLAMRQGRFEAAEERFQIYQFIAPDQANPHDSMAELLLFRGRYDEGQAELEKAIELRADFLPSYMRLLTLALLRDDPELARATIARVEAVADFPKMSQAYLLCQRDEILALLGAAQPSPTSSPASSPDSEHECRFEGLLFALYHGTLLRNADLAAAEALEGELSEKLDQTDGLKKGSLFTAREVGPGLLPHLEGARLAATGEIEPALERLRQARELLGHSQLEEGLVMLRNLLVLAETLERAGETDEARRVRESLDGFNPRFAETEPFTGLPGAS